MMLKFILSVWFLCPWVYFILFNQLSPWDQRFGSHLSDCFLPSFLGLLLPFLLKTFWRRAVISPWLELLCSILGQSLGWRGGWSILISSAHIPPLWLGEWNTMISHIHYFNSHRGWWRAVLWKKGVFSRRRGLRHWYSKLTYLGLLESNGTHM